jgi:hypothetical protein
MLFKRRHHQLIAGVLENLDADLLAQNQCYFAGGTVLALLHNEYRESNDIDFMVSDTEGYRNLRNLLTGKDGFEALAKAGGHIRQAVEVRADQYGVRGKVEVEGTSIKMGIVREARITFDSPGEQDKICGITTLCALDLAAEKLLANSDRWLDAAIFSRDVIDLAMMGADRALMKSAIAKAEIAYGPAIKKDLEKAIDRVLNKEGWIERCMDAMVVSAPKADVFQRTLKLGRHAGVAAKLARAAG